MAGPDLKALMVGIKPRTFDYWSDR